MDRPKAKDWTDAESALVVQLVLENEELLFGSMSGSGVEGINKSRKRKWKEIAEIINSQCAVDNRTPEQCRKKYSNIKMRASRKIAEVKRTPTGGGPYLSSLTPVEIALVSRMEERSCLFGISTGVDTDAMIPTATDVDVPANDEANMPELVRIPITTSSATATTSSTSEQVIRAMQHGFSNRGRKRKTEARTRMDILTEKNLNLDNKRIETCIGKLKVEKVKLIAETNKLRSKILIDLQIQYHKKRLATDFSNTTFLELVNDM